MRNMLTALFFTACLVPVVSSASNQTDTIAPEPNVTAIDELKRGSLVTVKGKVEEITDTDEFRLTDDSGKVTVYIGWQNFVPVEVGETVTVKGFVDDGLILELYARQINHSDGRITRLRDSD